MPYKNPIVGIYKITSPSGNVYIGQSRNIEKRFSVYRRTHAPKQHALQRSFYKYGVKAHKFEIVHELPDDVSQEILDAYEIFYCELCKNCGFVMLNIKEPGSGGQHSEETKNKMKGSGNHFFGKNHSEKARDKMKINRKGKGTGENNINFRKQLSAETKEKLRASLKGRVAWNKGKTKADYS